MPTITLRNVPAELHERLRERAAQNRRSLNNEIVHCLEQALSIVREEPAAYLERIRRLRAKSRGLPLNDEILREARELGRR